MLQEVRRLSERAGNFEILLGSTCNVLSSTQSALDQSLQFGMLAAALSYAMPFDEDVDALFRKVCDIANVEENNLNVRVLFQKPRQDPQQQIGRAHV